ncbi:Diacylglycerol kinase family enzyme [Raineyella antarctica]|uniref:Diacylglycerol kinase family enzyme n=1 Tax=Raineyella antarctica TaxID=1577474 RepID=A0A1G6GD31_9ACTN|nr:diacylglycerol kinase family protein [Raineyella antarctica]SDB79819.1 Diacylglycerol kinase family enzyme [Raineyella antarctica]
MDSSRRAAIVYNPTKVDLDTLRSAISSAEETHGWGPSLWIETTEEDPGTGQALQAVERGASMVVACGGDGTVRCVAQGVHGLDAAMGVIPQGTGNLLARNLHLPLDMEEAVEVAFGGTEESIDIATVDVIRPDGSRESADFVVMAGVGIDAQMIVNTDEDLKKKAGILAYVQALGRSVGGGDRLRVRYRVDQDRPRRARVHSAMIGNCGELPGGIVLLPDSRADDGRLEMVLLRPGGLLGWLQIVGRVAQHAVLRRSDVARKITGPDKPIRALHYLIGQDMEIQLTHAEPFELDGDLFGEVRAFRCTIERSALRVRTTTPPPEQAPGSPHADRAGR